MPLGPRNRREGWGTIDGPQDLRSLRGGKSSGRLRGGIFGGLRALLGSMREVFSNARALFSIVQLVGKLHNLSLSHREGVGGAYRDW